MPRGGHHGDAAEAADVGGQVGGALRQAGLRVSARGGCLSLPSWGAAAISLYERRSRKDAAALLDNRVPGLLAQHQCTTGPERRITRWEHEHLLEAVQQRLDANPHAMRQRRETVDIRSAR